MEDLSFWLASLDKLSFQNIQIEDKLNSMNILRTEPYMYISHTKNIYLIQNVIQGDIERAKNVAYYWDIYKINLGHQSPEYDELEQPKYAIYGISSGSDLVLVDNQAGDTTQYLSLLDYGGKKYAAMLQIL